MHTYIYERKGQRGCFHGDVVLKRSGSWGSTDKGQSVREHRSGIDQTWPCLNNGSEYITTTKGLSLFIMENVSLKHVIVNTIGSTLRRLV